MNFPTMISREEVIEYFSEDLEFNPRRAATYLLVGSVLIAYYFSVPHEMLYRPTFIVVLLGAAALCIKGIFLLRRSSEGLGLDYGYEEKKKLAIKPPRPLAEQSATMLRDFASGPLLLCWFLELGRQFRPELENPPLGTVFLVGALLLGLSYVVKRLTQPSNLQA